MRVPARARVIAAGLIAALVAEAVGIGPVIGPVVRIVGVGPGAVVVIGPVTVSQAESAQASAVKYTVLAGKASAKAAMKRPAAAEVGASRHGGKGAAEMSTTE